MERILKINEKFPNLHKLLPKGTNFEPGNPQHYIGIYNDYAFISKPNYFLAIDLMRYFKNRLSMPEEKIDTLVEILGYLNKKYISGDYWEELTKGYEISLEDISSTPFLKIDTGSMTRDLFYKDVKTEFDFIDLSENIKNYKGIMGSQIKHLIKSSISTSYFSDIKTALNAIVKDDEIVFRYYGISKPIEFTFQHNCYIFGIVLNTSENCDDLFNFDELENFFKL